MTINNKRYLAYKFLNSLFTGISIGSIFVVYQNIPPIVYSVGGISLSVFSLLVAMTYKKILNVEWFYLITLIVEGAMLLSIIIFLIMNVNLYAAIIIYSLYQITFTFGGYLARAETLFISSPEKLQKLDSLKQVGYLLGMGYSFLFFIYYEDDAVAVQVHTLHYSMLFVQFLILSFVVFSFNKDTENENNKHSQHPE